MTTKRCMDRSYDRNDGYFISNKSMKLTFDQNSPRREPVLENSSLYLKVANSILRILDAAVYM